MEMQMPQILVHFTCISSQFPKGFDIMKSMLLVYITIFLGNPLRATGQENAGDMGGWSSVLGKKTITSLFAVQGQDLILSNADGKHLQTNLGELSEMDREYVAGWRLNQNEFTSTRRDVSPATDKSKLVSLSQDQSPLIAIENSLDLLGQVSGTQIAESLQGNQLRTVIKTYTVNVPVTEQVTVFQERFERRCIGGRWVCVRVMIPIQQQNTRMVTEEKTESIQVLDDGFVAVMEALRQYSQPPTSKVEKDQIKRLLLRAYTILTTRDGK
jgi:hypothetical protein